MAASKIAQKNMYKTANKNTSQKNDLYILAFDTSTGMSTIAIGTANNHISGKYSNARVINSINKLAPRKHMELLFPYIDECLKAAGIDIRDLELIVAGIGPGSFSGIRLGTTVARTMASALGCPLIGMPTTENLLAAFTMDMIDGAALEGIRGNNLRIVAVVDGKNDQLYYQEALVRMGERKLARALELSGPPTLCPRIHFDEVIRDGADLVLIGDGLSFYQNFFKVKFPLALKVKEKYDQPTAELFLELLNGRRVQNDKDSWKTVMPLYLRLSQAETNFNLKNKGIEP